ncbi:6-phosphofructokinase [Planctomicrobium piriforme]|uniref:ATP-dependent 6-phosphofructokinase n=1 Tax=Planctomicrobium piriforme TaxID=1576369 RepID=A0A1I3THL1_9PLAN|nr:ATP-dependent 6-phosphofructokinase [Planctomicrobium piriforme]SFJ69929.1 6-phosphofructokinase 1 [Planctomicrobium piriforme]
MSSPKRVGVLTSGGDCPGLNAVIRGVVKSATRFGYEVVGFRRGYEGLVDPVDYMMLDRKNTLGIINQGGTILGSTNKGRFSARKGVDQRVELPKELIQEVKSTFRVLNIEGLICIGGDGSLAVAEQFEEHGLPVIGVPKTIDNDLSSTAFSFGFDSAVACATDAIDRLYTTAISHERVMVVEVMGRHAGWIALHAGIAGGAGVILIPEIPWNFENVCQKILERDRENKRFSVIVVAEGAHLPEGGLVAGTSSGNAQARLGGIGDIVSHELEHRLNREVRCVILGHLQRGGPPTNFDRCLATMYGAHALRLLIQKKFGMMVSYQPPMIRAVPIKEAVGKLAQVTLDNSGVEAARALGISFGDIDSRESLSALGWR